MRRRYDSGHIISDYLILLSHCKTWYCGWGGFQDDTFKMRKYIAVEQENLNFYSSTKEQEKFKMERWFLRKWQKERQYHLN